MGYIRDLKGIKTRDGKYIKPNVLIRAAQLNAPSKSQLEYLNSIGLKRIIDLRNEAEAIHDPDVRIGKAEYYNISLIDDDLNGVTHESKSKQIIKLKQMPTIVETYRAMFCDDYSLKAIKKEIRLIVTKHDYPTIIHCVTGKDRAGISVALLLYMLDVPYETIVQDYLKQKSLYVSTAIKYACLVLLLTFRIDLAKKVYDYFVVNKQCIDEAFKTINDNFGSVDKFISDYLELSQKDIAEFRDIILCEEQA